MTSPDFAETTSDTTRPRVLLLGQTEPLLAAAAPQTELHLEQVKSSRQALKALKKDPSLRAVVVGLQAAGTEHVELAAAEARELRELAPLTDVLVWVPDCDALPQDLVDENEISRVVRTADPAQALEEIRTIVEEQTLLPRLLALDPTPRATSSFSGICSRNKGMWQVFETCRRVAPTQASVLILGETGTGKELLARAIHSRSQRPGPFVPFNCGGIPENLFEAELFGHEKGTFTGATRSRAGLLREAEGGTVFLDEVGNLPDSAQSSLLRALQERMVRPIGGTREHAIDARVVAATSTPLDAAAARGEFRRDLLYRLDVIRLVVPPLRERPEDVLLLFGLFLQRLVTKHEFEPPTYGDSFVDALQSFPWPGNVRELENTVERLLLTRGGQHLTADDFREVKQRYAPAEVRGWSSAAAVAAPATGRRGAPDSAPAPPRGPGSGATPQTPPSPTETAAGAGPIVTKASPAAETAERWEGAEPSDLLDLPLQEALDCHERRYLLGLLERHRGDPGAIASAAGVSRRTLFRKLKKHDLRRHDFSHGH